MSAREALIILAHAQMCEHCRERLLNDPETIFRGRAVTDSERARLSQLASTDFATLERLAETSGYDVGELTQYREHPVVRLRHF
jgi:hypothetical protein